MHVPDRLWVELDVSHAVVLSRRHNRTIPDVPASQWRQCLQQPWLGHRAGEDDPQTDGAQPADGFVGRVCEHALPVLLKLGAEYLEVLRGGSELDSCVDAAVSSKSTDEKV